MPTGRFMLGSQLVPDETQEIVLKMCLNSSSQGCSRVSLAIISYISPQPIVKVLCIYIMKQWADGKTGEDDGDYFHTLIFVYCFYFLFDKFFCLVGVTLTIPSLGLLRQIFTTIKTHPKRSNFSHFLFLPYLNISIPKRHIFMTL